ncbi:MAG: methyltransferase [Methanosphaera sp.]|nr:methyltransferase [Methanosphaera sp.]
MKYEDVEYNECSQVYPPAEDTFLLIDNLLVDEDMDVLEIGGGSGLVSIFASRYAKSVDVCDINPYAIECMEANVKLNNRNNIRIIQSDLFENIDSCYDLILFNTPYLPVDEQEHIDDEYSKAWDGGADGRKVIDKFIKQAKKYLKKDGMIQLVQSSLSDNNKTLHMLEEEGFNAEITANEHIFFEDITLITARL